MEAVGERVARLRKARRITQEGLALKMHRSVSWVSKVEQGQRRVENISTLMQLASALGVGLGDLRDEVDTGRRNAETLVELRHALMTSRPAADPVGPIADDLETLTGAWFGEGARSDLEPAIPGVILRARVDGRPALVVRALILATSACRREGLHDLGWIAGRLALEAAVDPVDAAWARYRLAMTALHLGDLDEARSLLDFPRSDASPDAVAIAGAAELVLATAAVRDARRAEAEEALQAAEEAADRVGDGNRLWTAFGPANVALNRAAVALEDMRPDDATDALRGIRGDQVASRERRYSHRLLLAQASEMLRDEDAAYRHLAAAEHLDADAFAHDLVAGELVRAMLRRRSRKPAGLRAMAVRLRVAE
jgi:transcriptional regulator with XRE-family HTH domain